MKNLIFACLLLFVSSCGGIIPRDTKYKVENVFGSSLFIFAPKGLAPGDVYDGYKVISEISDQTSEEVDVIPVYWAKVKNLQNGQIIKDVVSGVFSIGDTINYAPGQRWVIMERIN